MIDMEVNYLIVAFCTFAIPTWIALAKIYYKLGSIDERIKLINNELKKIKRKMW